MAEPYSAEAIDDDGNILVRLPGQEIVIDLNELVQLRDQLALAGQASAMRLSADARSKLLTAKALRLNERSRAKRERMLADKEAPSR